MRRFLLLIGFVITFTNTAAVLGTTRYVNGTCGSNSWTGLSPVCSPTDGPKATIQAAITASSNGDTVFVAAGTYPEHIDFQGKAVALRSTHGPEATVIDGGGTDRVVTCTSGEGNDTLLEGFTITNGVGLYGGGGMYCSASSPTVRNCVFRNNRSDIGAAMRNCDESSPIIESCSFIDNFAEVTAAVINCHGHPVFRDCLFRDNIGLLGDGGLVLTHNDGITPTVINTRFIRNTGGNGAGGALDGSNAMWVNCVFSQNSPGSLIPGGGLATCSGSTIINCTFSGNDGEGLHLACAPGSLVFNSIVWGNGDPAVGADEIFFSDVQGGWSGPGSSNIDADPKFVQPGTNDVRLSTGSPCLDAGDNAALPPDELDLDGDADTTETIPFDTDGKPRIQNGVVDMGAYEGAFELMPPAEGTEDFDGNDFIFLVPNGGVFIPTVNACVAVWNVSGPDDATFLVTEYAADLYPGAGGYSDLAVILEMETSLAAGQYLANTYIPFDVDDLNGVDPHHVNLTRYDAEAGSWALAVSGNSSASPGHIGPVGDRHVSSAPATNFEPGDYGVYWDPADQHGFAWANLDRPGVFGLGVAVCPADCLQTPDGDIGIHDFLALLGTWGSDGPCDVNYDGDIDITDFSTLLGVWGPCAEPALAPRGRGRPLMATAGPDSASARALVRSPDLDGSGLVERADVQALHRSWGPCAGCPGDLDGDGEVGTSDLLRLYERWGDS